MNDYISRAAAIEALKEVNNPILVRFVICKAAIEAVPAADVVEVVRCRECAVPHDRWTGCPVLGGKIPPDTWYCASGKRKEKEQHDPSA